MDDVYEQVQQCRPYNYGSIMHHSENAFSKNGEKTITTKDSSKQGVIGQSDGLNAQDIEEINAYYFGHKCGEEPPSCMSGETGLTSLIDSKSVQSSERPT